MSAGGFFETALRRDHKLIGRETEFGGEAGAGFGQTFIEETRATFALGREHVRRVEHVYDLPGFGRSDQGRSVPARKLNLESARTPKVSFVRITAALLAAVDDLVNLMRPVIESGMFAAQFHPQRRQAGIDRGNFISIPAGGKPR